MDRYDMDGERRIDGNVCEAAYAWLNNDGWT